MAELTEKQREKLMECTDFEQLLEIEYGKRGEPAREKFESDAEMYCLAECLKDERASAGLSQEEFALKLGTEKSVISKIENGSLDIQLSSLLNIFHSLGKRISFSIV